MLYIILTIVYFALTIIYLLFGEFGEDWCHDTFIILLFIGMTVFCGYNSYKSIINPIYIEKEVENAQIPSIDTRKNNNGKYDKVYIDEENKILYVDKKVNNKGKVKIINNITRLDFDRCLLITEDITIPRIVVNKYVPKITRNSVNVYFNQKVEYIIYISSEYEINTEFNF